MDIQPQFLYSNAGINTTICISACVVTMVGINLTVDARLQIINLIAAQIAGGVIVGISSANIFTALEVILLGILSAFLQYVFKKIQAKSTKPISSNNVLISLDCKVQSEAQFLLPLMHLTKPQTATLLSFGQMPMGRLEAPVIVLGVRSGAGLITGLVILSVNKQSRSQIYRDSSYWLIQNYGLQQKWSVASQPELQLQEAASETGYKGGYSFM